MTEIKPCPDCGTFKTKIMHGKLVSLWKEYWEISCKCAQMFSNTFYAGDEKELANQQEYVVKRWNARMEQLANKKFRECGICVEGTLQYCEICCNCFDCGKSINPFTHRARCDDCDEIFCKTRCKREHYRDNHLEGMPCGNCIINKTPVCGDCVKYGKGCKKCGRMTANKDKVCNHCSAQPLKSDVPSYDGEVIRALQKENEELKEKYKDAILERFNMRCELAASNRLSTSYKSQLEHAQKEMVGLRYDHALANHVNSVYKSQLEDAKEKIAECTKKQSGNWVPWHKGKLNEALDKNKALCDQLNHERKKKENLANVLKNARKRICDLAALGPWPDQLDHLKNQIENQRKQIVELSTKPHACPICHGSGVLPQCNACAEILCCSACVNGVVWR